ncbi:SF0329 family protein [Vannielia sp. SX4]|uniref:SF0329 family protein n=1 Tax=Vannielia sp. SX4 TaxID=3463852 RepID=UPI00405A406D
MKWSKLKQRAEAQFADSLRGRIEVWTTRYRGSHDQVGESWITVDGKRIFSAGTLRFWAQYWDARAGLRATQSNEPTTLDEMFARERAIEVSLAEEGVLGTWNFNEALFDLLNISIEDAMHSEDMIVRAFGMLDRRLGKRRLRALDVREESPLVQLLYAIRCEAEGIRPHAGAEG